MTATHPVPKEHLTDEQLAAYLDGGLSLAERIRADLHLAKCSRCVDLLAVCALTASDMARQLPPPADPLLRWRTVLPAVAMALALMAAMLCGSSYGGQ